MRQQKRGKPWHQSGVREGYVMTWKSQPVGHAGLCGALTGRQAAESSLAASYLVLVGRNEPVTDSTA